MSVLADTVELADAQRKTLGFCAGVSIPCGKANFAVLGRHFLKKLRFVTLFILAQCNGIFKSQIFTRIKSCVGVSNIGYSLVSSEEPRKGLRFAKQIRLSLDFVKKRQGMQPMGALLLRKVIRRGPGAAESPCTPH